jgi:hypothetical protein
MAIARSASRFIYYELSYMSCLFNLPAMIRRAEPAPRRAIIIGTARALAFVSRPRPPLSACRTTEKWQLRIARVKHYLFVSSAILNWYSVFSIIMLTGRSAEECGGGARDRRANSYFTFARLDLFRSRIILMSLRARRCFPITKLIIIIKLRAFVYIGRKELIKIALLIHYQFENFITEIPRNIFRFYYLLRPSSFKKILLRSKKKRLILRY